MNWIEQRRLNEDHLYESSAKIWSRLCGKLLESVAFFNLFHARSHGRAILLFRENGVVSVTWSDEIDLSFSRSTMQFDPEPNPLDKAARFVKVILSADGLMIAACLHDSTPILQFKLALIEGQTKLLADGVLPVDEETASKMILTQVLFGPNKSV